ncbi:MAG: hypothetical protein JWO81_1400 [Alphaproteobacteria bacterium]|nr:hypothetical protein [Alphaproteobacteria bacterium]
MRHFTGLAAAVLATTLMATPAAACCISEFGAPPTGPVHAIVHQIAVAALKCGGLGTPAAIDRVCARRDRLLERAHRLGWCWGSRNEHFAAEMELYWLPCRRNRRWGWYSTPY